MKIKPVGRGILVKLDRLSEIVKDGIIVFPKKLAEKTRFGTILDLGEYVNIDKYGDKEKLELKIGDKIIINNQTGHPLYIYQLKWLDPDHRIINREEIYARVED